MPLRGVIRYYIQRLLGQHTERHLSESYPIRRLAQLTVYYWQRMADSAESIGRSSEGWLSTRGQKYGSAARIARNFINNLRRRQ